MALSFSVLKLATINSVCILFYTKVFRLLDFGVIEHGASHSVILILLIDIPSGLLFGILFGTLFSFFLLLNDSGEGLRVQISRVPEPS